MASKILKRLTGSPLQHHGPQLILLLTLWGLVSTQTRAQTVPPDSSAVVDTNSAAAIDTLTPPAQSEFDAPITYKAKKIFNDVQRRETILVGAAEVKYGDVLLTAEKITVDWRSNELTAEGMIDTTETDTAAATGVDGRLIREPSLMGTPVFTQSGDRMAGERMVYNFETRKGRVLRGRTDFEGGFYHGEFVKRVDDKVFNVARGTFTTCDLEDDPHYHFWSRRMKIITQDKVVAKPVVMKIGRIPVAALPFGVFPNQTGRRSGIVVPRYGESSTQGRYLREMGYYWAASDYWDAKGTVDFYERTGWLFRWGANYRVRYKLSGRISGSLTRKNFRSEFTERKERRWDVQVRHSQTLGSSSRLNAYGSFVSDGSFYQDLSSSLSQRLQREMRSNLTYSKSWPGTKNSLTFNLKHVRNLDTGTTSRTLPQISFSRGQSQIFGTRKKQKRPSFPGIPEPEEDPRDAERNERWYNFIYYSYGSSLVNTTSKYSNRPEQLTRRIDHRLNLSMSSSKKLFGWLGSSHSLAYRESWFDREFDAHYDEETKAVVKDTIETFASRRTFTYNLNANTKIYGMFRPPIKQVRALRHVVTPSVSFSFAPDFSDEKWGYFHYVQDSTGAELRIDRFGGTPTVGQKRISFSLRNLFQAKIMGEEKDKKIDLFTLDFSSSFNYQAKQMRLAPLSTSVRSSPSRNMSLTATATHNFYHYDRELNRRVNSYIMDRTGNRKIADLTNLRFTTTLRLRGKSTGGRDDRDRSGRASEEGFPDDEDMLTREEPADRFGGQETFSGVNISWRANLDLTYSLNRFNPENPTKNIYLRVSGAEMQLTKNWRIRYNAQYDLRKKDIVNHQFTFYRDLHCWEAQFRWSPVGRKEFYFKINIKASQLRDIKLEKRGGTSSYLGYY